jgi:hypothetical protein
MSVPAERSIEQRAATGGQFTIRMLLLHTAMLGVCLALARASHFARNELFLVVLGLSVLEWIFVRPLRFVITGLMVTVILSYFISAAANKLSRMHVSYPHPQQVAPK